MRLMNFILGVLNNSLSVPFPYLKQGLSSFDLSSKPNGEASTLRYKFTSPSSSSPSLKRGEGELDQSPSPPWKRDLRRGETYPAVY